MPSLGRSASAAPDRALGASRNGRKPRPIPLTAPLAAAHENKINALKCLEKRSVKLCFRCLRSCRKDPTRTATPRPKNAIEHDKIPACPPLRSVIFAQISPKPPLLLPFRNLPAKKTQKPYLKAVKRGQNSGKTAFATRQTIKFRSRSRPRDALKGR